MVAMNMLRGEGTGDPALQGSPQGGGDNSPRTLPSGGGLPPIGN